jgi:CRP-like cAMP-binding protein
MFAFMNRSTATVDPLMLAPFAHLGAGTCDLLCHLATLYHLKAREALFCQGDEAHSFYIVAEGGVRLVEYTSDGGAVALKLYGPGEIFGLLAVSGAYPYPATAEAIDDSVIIGWRGSDARELVKRCPDFGLILIDGLVSHVHQAHTKIRHLSADRVDRRIIRALLHYADKFGSERFGEVSIDVPLTQQALAEYTNTTVETVNRTLKMLERQGLIRCGRQHVDVLEPVKLMYMAGDEVAMQG